MKIDLANVPDLDSDLTAQVYNGIDNLATRQIIDTLCGHLLEEPQCISDTYNFTLKKQAPVLSMEFRGIRTSYLEKRRLIKELAKDLARVRTNFDRLSRETFDRTFNHNSPLQVKELFYHNLALPTIKKRNTKGEWAPSASKEALEEMRKHFYAIPFVNHVLMLRDLNKQLSFLAKVKEDERVYTSFNIAGTNTGRLSSSFSDFGLGTNVQNIDRRLRSIFIPDPGYIMVNIDLEQADSRNLGARLWQLFLSSHGEEAAGRYLDACESGDLHTSVAQLAWTGMDWSDDPKHNRKVADVLFYGQDSYRQTSKKLGHGTNYIAQPPTLSKRTNTPVTIVKDFQGRYFGAFPLILDWHDWVRKQLKKDMPQITTLHGRRRIFWDRPEAGETQREAAAFEPQSMTAHAIDYGLYHTWKKYDFVQLLAQVHDSILFQIPEDKVDYIPRIQETMKCKIDLACGREFYIPTDVKVGYNWGDQTKENPSGLKKLA